ncbi:hypothetical protein IW262DRAFT_1296771 [Armillaria fumosa]|nr:hypothetical protein IW262DRAFT_1296771 [Armillaria fumosa]
MNWSRPADVWHQWHSSLPPPLYLPRSSENSCPASSNPASMVNLATGKNSTDNGAVLLDDQLEVSLRMYEIEGLPVKECLGRLMRLSLTLNLKSSWHPPAYTPIVILS